MARGSQGLMAKGGKGGFDLMDAGAVPSAPKADNLGVAKHPGKTTMGTGGDAPRTQTAKNPKGG